MELRHIRYFVAAAKHRNFSKAAHVLNLSQPAVSRLIRELECELGTALFIRQRSGLDFTPAGETFFRHALDILTACDEAVKAAQEASPLPGKLSIGFITTALGSFLGDALTRFTHEQPEIELVIHEMPPGDQIVALRNRQIDVAFIGNPCNDLHSEIRMLAVKELTLEAAVSGQHRLAGRKAIQLRELAAEKFIGYDEEKFPGRNQAIVKACVAAGFQPALTGQARSLLEVLGMIGADAGVCLMPSDVMNLPHPNVVFLCLDDILEPISLAAAWLRDNKNPAIGSLLAYLKN